MHRTQLHNGVLVHFDVDGDIAAPDAAFTLTRQNLLAALLGGKDLGEMISGGSVEVDGNSATLTELIGYLDAPDPDFAIVTP